MADEAEICLDSVLETVLETSGKDANRQDALVLALHVCFMADGFNLVAIGDEGFETGRYSNKECCSLASPSSPTLTKQWNASSGEVYSLQYKQTLSSKRVCLVKALPIGDQIIINVMCSDKPSDLISLTLSIDQYTTEVQPQEGVTLSTFKNILKLFTTINKEINAKIKQEKQSTTKSTKPQTKTSAETSNDPLRVGAPRRPHPHNLIDPNPFGYGAGDLSPFGGPGGMILDPMRQGGVAGPHFGPRPPGFHPPGARYDPLSPFGPNIRPDRRGYPGGGFGGRGGGAMYYRPDPDHLPPPGSDDMFS